MRGVFYRLYVIIDGYSRYIVGWYVATGEDSILAREVIDDAITRNGARPDPAHRLWLLDDLETRRRTPRRPRRHPLLLPAPRVERQR